MTKFIKYENLDFRIDNNVYYSTSVKISLQSNIKPVLLADGSLLRYAPQETVIGSLSTEFYLTGSLPSYLNVVNSSESSVNCNFGGVNIDECYIKSLSFTASQFSPILLNINFDWYGKINTSNSTYDLTNKSISGPSGPTGPSNQKLSYLSHSNNSYISDISNVFGFSEIFSYTYNESCDRAPFFKIGEISPFRVAKINRAKSVTVDGNYFKKSEVSNIEGTDAVCNLYLKNYENDLLNMFDISGKIDSRSLNIDANGLLQSNLSINQRVAPLRSTL
ncbi:hypothetical protein EB169_00255 [archaeon]|nr:hypothetical protein [archaeon]NDB54246.1 hypothetical protein [archaeon]